MKKMDDYKDTFFLTNFDDELKLRCSTFYYMPGEEAARLLKDIKLGIKPASELRTYIRNRYRISNWLLLVEKSDFMDIAEYAVYEIHIERKDCLAFDIEVAYHR